ncbi:unnamed protein product [Cladocopium goreaui]|uniref:Pumilio-like 5 n=1 Tax=Cladocopium goreaui TaxID=2562237 RepID=A0A9P1CKZ2_9DINO|nr:unnamed protein product [Cladocopium goreaui]
MGNQKFDEFWVKNLNVKVLLRVMPWAAFHFEKCLDIATGELEEERRALLAELLWGPGPPLLEIMLDRFGNYIAQRVIALSSSQEEERLQELLEKVRHKLRQSTNGKRILQAARRKFEV